MNGLKTAQGVIRTSEGFRVSAPTPTGDEVQVAVAVVGVEAAGTVVAEVARGSGTVVDVVVVGVEHGSAQIGTATERRIVARVAEDEIATGIATKGYQCEFQGVGYSGEVVAKYGTEIGAAAVDNGYFARIVSDMGRPAVDAVAAAGIATKGYQCEFEVAR